MNIFLKKNVVLPAEGNANLGNCPPFCDVCPFDFMFTGTFSVCLEERVVGG